MVSDEPRIDFPCAYPLKIIFVSGETRTTEVMSIVQQHAPDADELNAEVVPSRNGNYASLRISIEATGESQLKALHRALLDLSYVKMVL